MATTVRICMAPSIGLSYRYPNVREMASKFALRFVEASIFDDYLIETQANMQKTPLSVFHDWWDRAQKKEYVDMLTLRHKNVRAKDLLDDKNLPWPDISTFQGLRPRLLAYGSVPSWQQGTRNEIYEIKPNHPSGSGDRDGLKKLKDVEQSYRQYHLSGIYERGMFYPQFRKKIIPLQPIYPALFKYLVSITMRRFKADLISIDLEVERKYPGVLLYRICVTLSRPDNWKKRQDWEAAASCVWRMLDTKKIGQDANAKKLIKALAESLEPVDDYAGSSGEGNDFSKVPIITVRPESIADELAGTVTSIRDAMYSQLIGLPGERYFLCCDENYLQQVIITPGKQKVESQIKMLGLGLAGVKAAPMNPMLSLLPAVVVTAADIVKYPVTHPGETLAAAQKATSDMVEYMRTHPKETLIAVGVTVTLTALLVITLATAGAATPITGPAAGGIIATEAATGTVAAGAVVGTVAAETATGAAGAVMPVTIMSETAAASSVSVSAVPDAIVISETTGTTQIPSVVSWARGAASVGPEAEELAKAGAQRAMDELLIKIMQEQVVQQSMEKVVSAGPAAMIIPATPAFASTAQKAAQGIQRAVSAGVVTLIQLSAVPLFASTIQGQQAAPSDLGKMVSLPPVGCLFLVRVMKDVFPYPGKLPEMYKPFDIDKYADQVQIDPNKISSGQAIFLGMFTVE